MEQLLIIECCLLIEKLRIKTEVSAAGFYSTINNHQFPKSTMLSKNPSNSNKTRTADTSTYTGSHVT
jgi:hypothetical protein